MHPLAPILSEHGVPFVRLTPRGAVIEVSEEARRLLGADSASVLGELVELARDTATTRRTLRTGDPVGAPRALNVRIGLRHCGSLRVRTVQLAGPDGEMEVLAVLSPESPDRVRRFFDAHQLTEREREVAARLSTGRGLSAVAADLAISVHTARRHTEKVYAKLGVHSRAELARWMGSLTPR
jgi:DNA-binding CsgD family transcriptional regulator